MKTNPIIEIEARLHRLERQNRLLTLALCAMAGVASVAAAKHSSSTIDAAEVRTQRFTLVDNHGKPLADTRCIDGVEIRAYLPHNVTQQ